MEADALDRHEYHEGEVLAMAGGTIQHSLIVMNAGRELGNRLKGSPCNVYDSNLKVRASIDQRFVYPDLSVICGKPELEPLDPNGHTVTNPRLIVEVLSPSTESYDRTEKFDHYRLIKTFEEYVLIWQVTPRVEVFRRMPDGNWAFRAYAGIETAAEIASLKLTLPLRDVYANVEFPAASPTPS